MKEGILTFNSWEEAKGIDATLLTIPELGRRLRLRTDEAGKLLDQLGLRWINDYKRNAPTKLARDNCYVIQIDGSTYDLVRWNYELILSLIETKFNEEPHV
jgi:hypothetical protein